MFFCEYCTICYFRREANFQITVEQLAMTVKLNTCSKRKDTLCFFNINGEGDIYIYIHIYIYIYYILYIYIIYIYYIYIYIIYYIYIWDFEKGIIVLFIYLFIYLFWFLRLTDWQKRWRKFKLVSTHYDGPKHN